VAYPASTALWGGTGLTQGRTQSRVPPLRPPLPPPPGGGGHVMACGGLRYGNSNMRLCVRRAAGGGQHVACGVRRVACGGQRVAAATTETAMRRQRQRAAICGSSLLEVTVMLFNIQYLTLLFLCAGLGTARGKNESER
jgi:hypothetical protein